MNTVNTLITPFAVASSPASRRRALKLGLSLTASVGLSLLTAFSATAQTASAANFPDRPVKFIVPLTPGSGADIAGRIVAKYLTELWKQPVIIENRPGAGGLIGTGVVVNAPADGYTLLVQSASYAANPAIYKKLPYDLKSLVDVNILGLTPYVMVTSNSGPYVTIKDLITAAKAKPGEVPFASAGLGSSTHLAAEYFNQTMGVELLHIPYKGSPEAVQDSMVGRTAFYMAPLDTASAHIKGGKLRALGVTQSVRSEVLPDVPTIAEQGHPGFDIGLWFGVWAPAATPAAVVQKINADINKAMQDPDVKASYARAGIRAQPQSPEAFAGFVRGEIAKYTKIAKDAKIEPQ
jgi:tripartite-type tricarboxylate transporter receptor subunit TctC